MQKEGHPFGEMMSRMLGLKDSERLHDSTVDYFLHLRNTFIDKIEGGHPNS